MDNMIEIHNQLSTYVGRNVFTTDFWKTEPFMRIGRSNGRTV
jgi:hypothetical protein